MICHCIQAAAVKKVIISPEDVRKPLCPGTTVTIEYSTSESTLTCRSYGAPADSWVTAFQGVGSNNHTEYLQLANSTNAAVQVYITETSIIFRVNFTASSDLNGTVLQCFSAAEIDNTTITLTGSACVCVRVCVCLCVCV